MCTYIRHPATRILYQCSLKLTYFKLWRHDVLSHTHAIYTHTHTHTHTPPPTVNTHTPRDITMQQALWPMTEEPPFLCVTGLIHTRDHSRTLVTWTRICVTWPIRIWDVTHSYDVPWLIHTCDHSRTLVTWIRICVTWPIRIWDMTYSYDVPWLIHTRGLIHAHWWHGL